MEIIKKELIKNISNDWEIKEYKFGNLLLGIVHIDDNSSEAWSKAGIIICDKNIPNILDEFILLKMKAPFKVIYLSNNYQIITWASKDLENIRKTIEIVKKIDS